jgi:hypothetical protein
VCVRERERERFRNVVGLKTAEIQWVEKHLPVTSDFLQCTKIEENF